MYLFLVIWETMYINSILKNYLKEIFETGGAIYLVRFKQTYKMTHLWHI